MPRRQAADAVWSRNHHRGDNTRPKWDGSIVSTRANNWLAFVESRHAMRRVAPNRPTRASSEPAIPNCASRDRTGASTDPSRPAVLGQAGRTDAATWQAKEHRRRGDRQPMGALAASRNTTSNGRFGRQENLGSGSTKGTAPSDFPVTASSIGVKADATVKTEGTQGDTLPIPTKTSEPAEKRLTKAWVALATRSRIGQLSLFSKHPKGLSHPERRSDRGMDLRLLVDKSLDRQRVFTRLVVDAGGGGEHVYVGPPPLILDHHRRIRSVRHSLPSFRQGFSLGGLCRYWSGFGILWYSLASLFRVRHRTLAYSADTNAPLEYSA